VRVSFVEKPRFLVSFRFKHGGDGFKGISLQPVMPRQGLYRVDRLEAQFSVYSSVNRVSMRGIIKDSPERPERYHLDDTAWVSPWFASIEPQPSPSSPTCGPQRRSLIQSRLCRVGNR
jgi:hypothetical protein